MTRTSRTAAARPVSRIAVVSINRRGWAIAEQLERDYPVRAGISAAERRALKLDIISCPAEGKNLHTVLPIIFRSYHGLVLVMATGIAVRVIAPCLKSKYADPAVVTVDTSARHAIALASGHEGGANLLAVRVANTLGAEPVITTGTDAAKRFVVGIGSRRGIRAGAVLSAIREALAARRIALADVRYLATVELKAREAGILAAAAKLGIPLRIISPERIRDFRGAYQKSARVQRLVGVGAVAEPVCQLCCARPLLVLPRIVRAGVTIAVAEDLSAH